MHQRSIVRLGYRSLSRRLPFPPVATVAMWLQRRQHRRWWRQGRQDRRHRPPFRRPVRSWQGHPALGRAGRQAGQRLEGHPRLDPRGRRRSTTRPRPTSARTPRPSSRRTTRSSAWSATSTRASASRPSRSSLPPTSPRSRPPTPARPDPWRGPARPRPYKTYFRTCTTDIVQGGFAAKFLIDQGIKNVATIHDKKTYGQGLVDFTDGFKEGGGTVVAAETINPDESNYPPVVSKVSPSSPQPCLLRRRVPAGRPAVPADEGRRPQRPAHGR